MTKYCAICKQEMYVPIGSWQKICPECDLKRFNKKVEKAKEKQNFILTVR